MLWLKFIHITGIAIWIAGLLHLASLLAGHAAVRDQQDFARVRMASRFAYMGVISPAAFVAVAAGTALLFVSDALHPWMFAKLGAVTVLVIVHVQYAYVLTHLAVEGAQQPTVKIRIMVGAIIAAALAVLYLVLAKPVLNEDVLPGWMQEPGFMKGAEDRAAAPHRPATHRRQ
ncbi:MAG TPA: CopD family protein [Erythrobacter sp.]|nr:CopD family protein [Erythrobacter sp.]